jgi:lipoprotein NlpI
MGALRFELVLLLLRSIAVKHRNWLDIAEYIMLFGSGVGSLASVASQQVIYTAAPLSFLALLSVVNRHRLQQHLERVTPAVTRLDRRFSAEMSGLKQQVDALPNADSFRQLSAIVTHRHQQAISQLAQNVSTLQTELIHQTAPLQAHDLTVLSQEIQNLQTRSANLEGALSEVTAYLNQVAAATRVNELEGTTAKFSADLTYLKTEVGQLQTHLQTLLDEQKNINPRTLQDQIDHLNRRLSNLPQPFDASLLKKDIDSLLSVVTDLVSRRELSRVAAEVEKLHQQNRSLEQAVTVVRLASNVLRKQLDTVSAKVHAREETLNQLPGAVKPQTEGELNEDLKSAMTKLAKGLIALQKRFNHLATSPDLSVVQQELEQLVASQVETMQQQLTTVQQATQTLEQEQQDLRQFIDRLPETNDRTLSTQLSALIARIDWAEQRITQAESYWSTLQAQVEATVQDHLESVSQPIAQKLDSPQALSAEALAQLNTLLDRIEWAETNLGSLQQQINENIQPQLDELSQQMQGFSPDLEISWATLADISQPAATEEVGSMSVEEAISTSPADNSAIENLEDGEEILPPPVDHLEEPLPASPVEDTEVEDTEASPPEPVFAVSEQSCPVDSPILDTEASPPEPAFADLTDTTSETTWEEIPRRGRALLEAALAQTQERIIIVSPYPTSDTIDAALLQQFERVLQQGGHIDIGWGHLVDEQQVRTPRCLHQPAINTTGQGFLHILLRQLAQMKQRYAQQFHFKILGTHENFLVCDQDFAVIGVFPVPGEPTTDAIGLRNDDAVVIQSLIDRFDEPDPDPNNPIAYFNRGVTRYDLGDKQGAITDYTQALKASPDDDVTYNNRGLARYELGDRASAMMDFNNALQLNPRNAAAYFNRGCTRTDLGDKIGSIADFSNAIDHQPDFAMAYFCRAIAHTRLDNRPSAIADYTTVIQLNPQDAMAYFYRGVAHFRAGNKQVAATDLRQAEHLFAEQKDKSNRYRVRAAIQELEEATLNSNANQNQPKFWPL